MDPLSNPYAPGAGSPPPELAGRDNIIKKASIALQRIAAGQSSRSLIFTGLRGVGKTVLLNRLRQEAEMNKMMTVRFEATEDRSLPALLVPALRAAIFKLNRGKAASALVKKGLSALTNFARAMKLRYHDIEIALETNPDTTMLFDMDLNEALFQLFLDVGEAAKEKKTAIVLFIDELQALKTEQLASLIMALHLASQDLLPITMIAAGLPQVSTQMGEAKTYAERLFEFPEIGQLDKTAAKQALVIPAKKLGVKYTEQALETILQQTKGYAYFLQEWGKHAWEVSEKSPITQTDANNATLQAITDLDASFFRVRFSQLSAMQKQYLHAMAKLGEGPSTSGDIANLLEKPVTALAPIRSQLIQKGLLYSPTHGETAFTVPLFDAFMRRVITDD